MPSQRSLFQICVVVPDVLAANAHWARVLGRPAASVERLFPPGILHISHGQQVDYVDCQVAKYDLGHLVLELMQPGPGPSPWRDFLDRNGPGVFHVCLKVDDRRALHDDLAAIGVGLPYHVGYWPGGSYSYVDATQQLGLELSINHNADMTALMQDLLSGRAQAFDELKDAPTSG
ncbi:MAG: hypothetical protein RIQ60_581 [Pseudomonadota bacterium]|jgi:catechol 2,3-dioxygenase-like lactoylglutathione lyase family enzyme